MIYSFRLQYRREGGKRGRTEEVQFDSSTLINAWFDAIEIGRLHTSSDEILSSITYLGAE